MKPALRTRPLGPLHGPPFAFFGGALALSIWDRGWQDSHLAAIAFLVVFGPLLGVGVYDGVRRAGLRVSRPGSEQAADYEDRP